METRLQYIDTHAHLPMLTHAEEKTLVDRAQQAGLYRIVTVATEKENWATSQRFAQTYEFVYFTLGLHPHEAKDWKSVQVEMEAYFPKSVPPPKCVGIGETGLDFHYNLSPRDAQIEALTDQMKLAARVNLPLIIHCRDSFVELYDLIRQVGLGKRGGVMHCFTGNEAQAKEAISLGLKISFSGIVTFKNAEPLRAAAKGIPLSEILVETDCPFLAPVPLRGQPNEPSFLPHTVKTIAAVRGEDEAKVAQATTQNALEFFQLPA